MQTLLPFYVFRWKAFESCLDLYGSESRKIHTKATVDVSERGEFQWLIYLGSQMNSLGETFAREGWACGLVVLCGEWPSGTGGCDKKGLGVA